MKDTGGPAFPGETFDEATANTFYRYGMTMRDWFAGMALSGWLASFAGSSVALHPDNVAVDAYLFADAMLAERVKE